jgi:hypothetical protein
MIGAKYGQDKDQAYAVEIFGKVSIGSSIPDSIIVTNRF